MPHLYIQGQTGQVPEQADLLEGVPALQGTMAGHWEQMIIKDLLLPQPFNDSRWYQTGRVAVKYKQLSTVMPSFCGKSDNKKHKSSADRES